MTDVHKINTTILVVTAIILLIIIIIAMYMYFSRKGIYATYDWTTTGLTCPQGDTDCYTRLAGKTRPLTEQEQGQLRSLASG